MAQYKSFIHVERFEDSKFNIPIFLNNMVFVFAKLDGTNHCAWADSDGNIHCGSRKREISKEHDNAQSFLYFTTEDKYAGLRKWLTENPRYILYSEWLHGMGGAKQTGTIKGYEKPGLWVIDVFDTETGKYVPYPQYRKWLESVYDQVEPPLYIVDHPSYKDIQEMVENHFNLPEDVLGEGIVIKNYDYVDQWGHYQVAKIVNAESKVGKGRIKTKVPLQEVEKIIIDTYVTNADCEKAKQKVCVKFNLDEFEVNNKTMGFYLNALYQDLIEEELWTILKKLKNPTINFGLLRQGIYLKGRQYLGLA